LTGIYLLTWIVMAGPEAWQTPLYLFWTLVFATGSFVVYTKTNNRLPFYMYGSVALALLAAATANMFDGAVLTIMYAIEICAIIVLANAVAQNSPVAQLLSVLYIGLGILSLQHMTALTGYGTFSAADAWALLVVTVSLLISGFSILKTKPDIVENDTTEPEKVLFVTALAYIFVIIWLQLHEMMSAGVAVAISLIIYTVVGLGLYFSGHLKDMPNMRKIGAFIIGGVVLRLLLVDVWNLNVTERIIVFFVVGLLLISTALIKRK